MVLYVIGLGLGSEEDITVRGLKAVRGSTKVLLEHFGPLVAGCDKAKLAAFYGKDVSLAGPHLSDSVYATAKDEDVSFLVVGDPFRPNTMPINYVFTKAKELGVQVEVIQNVSTSCSNLSCGLKGNKFGKPVSIPRWNEHSKPDGFFDAIVVNGANGVHTMCYLDIEAEQPNAFEAARGEASSIPPRYMSVGTALRQVLEVATKRGKRALALNQECVGFRRPGQPTQEIVVGTLSQLLGLDFGKKLGSLVICGKTDTDEDKLLDRYRLAAVAAEPIEGSPRILVNCPGLHGLTAFTTPNAFHCDVCRGTIPAGRQAYGCRRCDYDACINCSMGRASGSPEGGAARAREVSAAELAANIARMKIQMETSRMVAENAVRTAELFNFSSCNCTCTCSKCRR